MIDSTTNQSIKTTMRVDISEPVISREMQLDLLGVVSTQIMVTGRALSRATALISSDTLAGEANKKALEVLLADTHKQIMGIGELVGVVLICSDQHIVESLIESSRTRLKAICRLAIESSKKSGGE
ncbi:hypothetical protein [Methylobacter tundripaludum]|uniref:Uncharacterized protein n=1 Tax=Methylobacter tundripaludum (strain ATCC BAA-1195 / DSM 17260 / SV96) TaxID=697282 RepID=G3ISE1_METTV|nr:hypothetical protein [Methylobacter tundripaludum]EGW22311.1 hypothetical protein Mettu_1120 [Methylobacter tundripaludum SV96]